MRFISWNTLKQTRSLLLMTMVLFSSTLPTAQAEMMMPPPPSVELLEIKPETIRVWHAFSGTLAAVEIAELKPQVNGEITQVLFQDGQIVKKGQALFVIDPRPYQAEVNRFKAQLASAKSRAKLAKEELERSAKLVKSKLVSQSVYDTALNEYNVAALAIDEAKSALVESQINLDFSTIRAPFTGRISRAELTIGNIVDAQMNPPVLATVVASDKLYAEFSVDERTYIKAKRSSNAPTSMPVELTLADDDVVYTGTIYSFDNQLNKTSGTIRARAIFDNTDGVLTPGMFANIRLGSSDQKPVFLVPQMAVGTNQNKKFVYVVDESNTAMYREVTLGEYHGDLRVVETGLVAGDKVIIKGLSHIRPNSVVNPTPSEPMTAEQP